MIYLILGAGFGLRGTGCRLQGRGKGQRAKSKAELYSAENRPASVRGTCLPAVVCEGRAESENLFLSSYFAGVAQW